MLGIFIGETRIGSILHFPKLRVPCWVAYAAGGVNQSFKTRKEAIAWLAAQYEQKGAA